LHLSLHKGSPDPRPVQSVGEIVAIPEVDSLHPQDNQSKLCYFPKEIPFLRLSIERLSAANTFSNSGAICEI